MTSTMRTTRQGTQPPQRVRRVSVQRISMVRKLDDLIALHRTGIATVLAAISLATAIIALIKITPQELYRILPF